MMILTLSLLMLAAASNASMDLLQFYYPTTIFARLTRLRSWIDPSMSWKNKYKKNKEGVLILEPRFLGSTTFLVWTTDAWHFLQMIMWTSMQAALALHFPFSSSWGVYPIFAFILDISLYKIIMGSLETLMLKTLNKRP